LYCRSETSIVDNLVEKRRRKRKQSGDPRRKRAARFTISRVNLRANSGTKSTGKHFCNLANLIYFALPQCGQIRGQIITTVVDVDKKRKKKKERKKKKSNVQLFPRCTSSSFRLREIGVYVQWGTVKCAGTEGEYK
jgi:hypothetical protein